MFECACALVLMCNCVHSHTPNMFHLDRRVEEVRTFAHTPWWVTGSQSQTLKSPELSAKLLLHLAVMVQLCASMLCRNPPVGQPEK